MNADRAVSGNLFRLLRTPILLDVFWRTFVDIGEAELEKIKRIQTRHGILSAFWRERIIESSRHSGIPALADKLQQISLRAASNIGPFVEISLDEKAVSVLVLESVLVKAGRLQPRLEFRHPLFRDFALAQLCLSQHEDQGIVVYWKTVQGNLQQRGSLRAILEVLADPDANDDFPEVQLDKVLATILDSGADAAHSLAYTLGMLRPSVAIDPATCSAHIRWPAFFGRELVASARFHNNALWADYIAAWPIECDWHDADFVEELYRYAYALRKSTNKDPDLQACAIIVARRLRVLSETARFASSFDHAARSLKMRAIQLVVPLDRSEETFAWVEREIPQLTWCTRHAILNVIPFLAECDAPRTAMIYRDVIALQTVDGKPHVDLEKWQAAMDYYAIEWSLSGSDGRRSLMREHPLVFVPVALDLAEALILAHTQEHNENMARFAELADALSNWPTEGARSGALCRGPDPLRDLIDVKPDRYWQSAGHALYHRLLCGLQECVEHFSVTSPEMFVDEIVPLLRRSSLATIHSFVLSASLERASEEDSREVLSACLRDARLFHVRGLMYWIEQGIAAAWPPAGVDTRHAILENIEGTLCSPQYSGGFAHAQFLCQVPEADLTPEQRELIAARKAAGYRPTPRPHREPVQAQWAEIDRNEVADRSISGWPERVDKAQLGEMYEIAVQIAPSDKGIEKLEELVTRGVQSAEAILGDLDDDYTLFSDSHKLWLLEGLEKFFEKFRKLSAAGEDQAVLPPTLVERCAQLSLAILRNELGTAEKESADEGADLIPQTPWVSGLSIGGRSFHISAGLGETSHAGRI